jgi:hypothetical protein
MKRRPLSATALTTLILTFCFPLTAQQKSAVEAAAIEPAAMEALNRMGAYLRTLKDFQVRAEVTTEDVLSDGEKLQSSHTSNLLAHMPNKLLSETKGDLNDNLLLYDGKLFTLFARRLGYYATVPAPSTIAELIDEVRDKYDLDVPLVDLFLWGGPSATTNEITSAADFGPAEVSGVTCEHYAYRQPGLDWQVWIQLGDHPLPRKLVLTTLTDDARPQHTSVFEWNLAPSYNDASFNFEPPPDAHRIVFAPKKQSSEGKQ